MTRGPGETGVGHAAEEPRAPDEDAGFDFAAALEELETIVSRLDRDEVDLDEAIALFRHGIGRVAEAQAWLDEASGRIEELIAGRSGRLDTRPFDPPVEPDDASDHDGAPDEAAADVEDPGPSSTDDAPG